MRNFVKLMLIAVLCLGLLTLVGCGKKAETGTVTDETTTIPQETTEATTEEVTTEKPVNIVEDPLNNGEGDPTDAMDTTDPNQEVKPGVDIEVEEDDDSSNTGNTDNGNTGNTDNGGNSGSNTGSDSGDDDFVIDFDDLT